ncbi:MAG: Hpt domain-containing protein, partial [Candidatus Scalindua sp.]
YENFREFTHALKGSSGSIGAEQLFNCCKECDMLYTEDSGYIQALQKITAVFSKTEVELTDYLSNSTDNESQTN